MRTERTLPCCIDHLHKTHAIVHHELLAICIFYRRIIGLRSVEMWIYGRDRGTRLTSVDDRNAKTKGSKRLHGTCGVLLTNKTIERELRWRTGSKAGRTMQGRKAHLYSECGLSDTSVTENCNSPAIHDCNQGVRTGLRMVPSADAP